MYFRCHKMPPGKNDKPKENKSVGALALVLLIYPRLISFRVIVQVGRRAREGAKSAVSHGWLFARPACTVTLKMPQAPAGLNSRKRLFEGNT